MIFNYGVISSHYDCICMLVLTSLKMVTSGQNMSVITTY